MPLIIPSNSITGGYEVANSLRFDDGSSDYLSRTPSSTGNTKKFTISFWCKRSALGTDQDIFHVYSGSGERSQILFLSGDTLQVELESANLNKLVTSRVFRDPSAWMHIVVVYDSDNGTSGNRVILYVNGVRETSFSTETYPSSGSTSGINTTTQHEISSYDGAGYFYDGYLSEFVLLDGIVADPTSFGEFDEDTGIWKPIDVSGLTFGTNGFYLDFENSGSLGADVSGNGNNFTVNNLTSIDQTTDTPTNNFCTLNAIVEGQSNVTYSEGNLKASESVGDLPSAKGTIAVSSGKWYWEGLLLGGNGAIAIGTDDMDASSYPHNSSTSGDGWTYHYDGSGRTSTGSNITIGSTYTTNDIIGVALDMDNGTCKFYKNGTEQTTGSWSGLNAYGSILPAFYLDGITWFANFGQEGSFGGNVTAQGNADGNGFGNFYYAPPSGYYALNTKNLAEYG